MTGVPKIEIVESVEELRDLMKQQKNSLKYVKIQALYLLKVGVAETVRYVAVIVGRQETTVHRWLQTYRKKGIEGLLEENPKTGRPKKLERPRIAKVELKSTATGKILESLDNLILAA